MYFVDISYVIDCVEGVGDGVYFVINVYCFFNYFGVGCGIDDDGFYWVGVYVLGIGVLCVGIRYLLFFVFEIEYFDVGF